MTMLMPAAKARAMGKATLSIFCLGILLAALRDA
ncbi:Uncharacterised protein [Mycobacterium tuberculosis]|nr:Uncharacterised protein [Mycobacterium tuberculosis]